MFFLCILNIYLNTFCLWLLHTGFCLSTTSAFYYCRHLFNVDYEHILTLATMHTNKPQKVVLNEGLLQYTVHSYL